MIWYQARIKKAFDDFFQINSFQKFTHFNNFCNDLAGVDVGQAASEHSLEDYISSLNQALNFTSCYYVGRMMLWSCLQSIKKNGSLLVTKAIGNLFRDTRKLQ